MQAMAQLASNSSPTGRKVGENPPAIEFHGVTFMHGNDSGGQRSDNHSRGDLVLATMTTLRVIDITR